MDEQLVLPWGQAGLAHIGYQGYTPATLLADLRAAGVRRVVDVRLNPISRKRGFSKSALSATLADAGISYVHYRALGNPPANRPGFGGSPEQVEAARAAYGELLTTPAAQAALIELVEAARTQIVALLCVEADVARCHRFVLWHRFFMGTLVPGGDLDRTSAAGGHATPAPLARSAVAPRPTRATRHAPHPHS